MIQLLFFMLFSIMVYHVLRALSHSVVSDSLQSHRLQPARLLCPWGFSRQAHWSGCHAPFQGIFPTRGLSQDIKYSHLCYTVGPCCLSRDFPGGSDGNKSACNAGDPATIPGLGRSPGEGSGHPLQYSCLENPMDRGA